ncbi:Nucleoside-diphosphate-sugar epimerase [Brevinema andersonii]|uniref:Nucleoside-diphosphate-sugar epimerase n=1 Tax=Brevinema andersonii TaxID=34097 RepID=A0A1I1DPE2_BREAD|nr:NAD-dependent epimerase/dehydratase family protein [Brevinema andersonii]SFB74918.1 Nucleoside-diphosphate-sugar epimerase [Brevinema andersonii]
MKKFLITGALGQIGTELALFLSERYGADQVIISDRESNLKHQAIKDLSFEQLDVLDFDHFCNIVQKRKINYIIHLAAILSATGETNPQKLWQINMTGLYHALEAARQFQCGIFTPSSIAVFGAGTPSKCTPQDTIMRPSTIYGISKLSGELLCDYYFERFNVDTRGVRFPGLVSYKAPPGGGTTDYAVDIFYQALQSGVYRCPLRQDTCMDMMYMDDALEAIVQLIEADPTKLKHRNAFNVSAMSFSPKEIAEEIKKYIPNFRINYEINPVLQKIADSWPKSLDTSAAQEEWGFSPRYNLEATTRVMISHLKEKIGV